MVKGETILRIILSKFSTALSFIAFLSSSSPSSCYGVRSPSWMSFLPMLLSFYWPGCLILPHYGFLRSYGILLHSSSQQSTAILRSEIQRLSLILHSSRSIPPHWLLGLEFVVRLTRHPSCATRFSFVT